MTPLVATGVGVALLGLGVVYLVVACESLPGFMGPTAGDTSPRTGLGVAGLLLGLAALTIAALLARRQWQRR
jgi:amino acid permease